MNDLHLRYHSYLLRIWHELSLVGLHWRVSLTSVYDRRQLGFPDLEAAFHFLSAQVQEWERATEDDNQP